MTPILEQPHTTSHVHYMAVNPEPVERFLAEHARVTQVLLEAKNPYKTSLGRTSRSWSPLPATPKSLRENFW